MVVWMVMFYFGLYNKEGDMCINVMSIVWCYLGIIVWLCEMLEQDELIVELVCVMVCNCLLVMQMVGIELMEVVEIIEQLLQYELVVLLVECVKCCKVLEVVYLYVEYLIMVECCVIY